MTPTTTRPTTSPPTLPRRVARVPWVGILTALSASSDYSIVHQKILNQGDYDLGWVGAKWGDSFKRRPRFIGGEVEAALLAADPDVRAPVPDMRPPVQRPEAVLIGADPNVGASVPDPRHEDGTAESRQWNPGGIDSPGKGAH